MKLPFRFDAERHEYTALDTGEILPSVTAMLKATGHIDDRFYTEEARHRGTVVHRLTARFDLEALEDAELSGHRFEGYVRGHMEATAILQPDWWYVEQPEASAAHRFAGTPDRAGKLYNLRSVLELKTGPAEKWHQLQTALQAILLEPILELPAREIQRFTEYLKADGRFTVEHHQNPRDFDEAFRVIRRARTICV